MTMSSTNIMAVISSVSFLSPSHTKFDFASVHPVDDFDFALVVLLKLMRDVEFASFMTGFDFESSGYSSIIDLGASLPCV